MTEIRFIVKLHKKHKREYYYFHVPVEFREGLKDAKYVLVKLKKFKVDDIVDKL